MRKAKARKEKYDAEQSIQKQDIKAEELHECGYNVQRDPGTKLVTEQGEEQVKTVKRKKVLDFG